MKNGTFRIVSTRLLVASMAVIVSLATHAANPAAGSLRLTLANDRITVAGAVPKGAVILFGAARAASRDFSGFVHLVDVADEADADGNFTFELPGQIPSTSAWLVVDLTNGQTATNSPPGSRFRGIDFPAGLLKPVN